ncbi:MAG TPA: phosphoribosyltransferase family protein [Egicoccus sp.]|nr:phosphoribosyltransferase family protein [Egicoccus sp.]HSK24468.1 phosphoribosyltransferase family protein [Egicoccus sp.]
MRYADRTEGGQRLAALLRGRGWHDPIVLALPRGGVPVAAPIAAALGAPLDVIVVRKLGAPRQPELAIGAIAEPDIRVLDPTLLDRLRLSGDAVAAIEADERLELQRRIHHYRGDHDLPSLAGRSVIVVDDGLATGATAVAACRAARAAGAAELVFAVPVGSGSGLELLRAEADEVVCPVVPRAFRAVGQWYERFGQTSDEEVLAILAAHRVAKPDTDAPR